MTRLPRLLHRMPNGPVTTAPEPIPVAAIITWHDERQTTEDAMALAWMRTEVLVEWTTPWGAPHQVWVGADHVRRTDNSAAPRITPRVTSGPWPTFAAAPDNTAEDRTSRTADVVDLSAGANVDSVPLLVAQRYGEDRGGWRCT